MTGEQAVNKKLAFVIDLKRCIGCDTCVVGCKVENQVAEGAFRLQVLDSRRDRVLEKPQGTFPNLHQHWLPTMCHHCEEAPCIRACPTNTLWRRDEDGLVMLDTDKCIGCQRCGEECPYDALSFDATSGVADKCTGCVHRVDEGLGPACELVCPTRAIHFGDLNDEQSHVSKLIKNREVKVLGESTGAKPQIYYLEP